MFLAEEFEKFKLLLRLEHAKFVQPYAKTPLCQLSFRSVEVHINCIVQLTNFIIKIPEFWIFHDFRSNFLSIQKYGQKMITKHRPVSMQILLFSQNVLKSFWFIMNPPRAYNQTLGAKTIILENSVCYLWWFNAIACKMLFTCFNMRYSDIILLAVKILCFGWDFCASFEIDDVFEKNKTGPEPE